MSGWRRVRWSGFGLGLLAASVACQGQFETPELDAQSGAGGRASLQGGAGRSGSGGRGADVETQGLGGRSSPASSSPDAGAPVALDAGAVGVAPERQYCDAHAVVFREKCGNGSCHTNRGATIGDFAVGPTEAARYVGRSSVRNVNCGLIIDPDEPQNSLILTKVTGEYPVELPCGGPMPVGSIAIDDVHIDCISDWVEQFRR